MRVPLYLSKRKAKKCIYVPVKITEHLNIHHIEIVRFIYRCYLKRINTILNIDNTTNKPLQICAFMSAVKPFPALLILPDDDIENWYHEIKNRTKFSTSILKDPKDTILGIDDATLVGHNNLKRMSNLKTMKWSLFLIDDIEEVIKVACIKKIEAKFHIGITNYDFIRNPNYQLQKDILKWIKHHEKISMNFTLLNSEFWLRKYQENHEHVKDVQNSGIESVPLPPSGFQTKNNKTIFKNKLVENNKNKLNSKKRAEKDNSINNKQLKENFKNSYKKIVENPFPDSPIDFEIIPETQDNKKLLEKPNNSKKNKINNSPIEDERILKPQLDDDNIIKKPSIKKNIEENFNKKFQKKSKHKFKKITGNLFPDSLERKNEIIPETSVKYSILDNDLNKPSTSGLKNGINTVNMHVKKQKFSFDDNKSKRNKLENDLHKNLKSLENKSQIICTTESDRILAEVLDINSQILDVEDILQENTPVKSLQNKNDSVKSSSNIIIEEMEPDPILDALFFSSNKKSNEDEKFIINKDVDKITSFIEIQNEIKSVGKNEHKDASFHANKTQLMKKNGDENVEKSLIYENTESEKLLDMLFSF